MPKKKTYKRANGEGSVYKLSGNRRRPWIARITLGFDEDGKQIYQTLGYFSTQQKAKDCIALNKVNPISPRANISLKELYDEWSDMKYKYIAKSTADGYKAAWLYLKKIESEKIRDIRAINIQKIIDECHASGKSRATLHKIKVLSTSLLGYASENDIVNKNYATFLKLPKEEKEEKEVFSDEDIKTLFENDDTPWVDTVLILIYTGMRISELLGIEKSNIDMDNRVIVGGVKTDAGKNRVIPISDKIYKYIEKRYKNDSEYLITRADSKPVTIKYYRDFCYYPALETVGVKKLTPHSCRHTFASLIARSGADTLAIQRILGHTDYAFTANQYTHTNIDDLKKAIDMI